MATMPSKEPKEVVVRKRMLCPLPFCPAPNLFVARKGARRHCIGCWRKYTPGVSRRLRQKVRAQKRPPQGLLRLFSPQQSADGPPPVLLYPKLEVVYPKLKFIYPKPKDTVPYTDFNMPLPALIAAAINSAEALEVDERMIS